MTWDFKLGRFQRKYWIVSKYKNSLISHQNFWHNASNDTLLTYLAGSELNFTTTYPNHLLYWSLEFFFFLIYIWGKTLKCIWLSSESRGEDSDRSIATWCRWQERVGSALNCFSKTALSWGRCCFYGTSLWAPPWSWIQVSKSQNIRYKL